MYFIFQELEKSMEFIQCVPDLPDLADLADFFINDEESQDCIVNFDDNNGQDPPQNYECNLCESRFASSKTLDEHQQTCKPTNNRLNTNSNPNQKRYQCDKCSKSYSVKKNLKRHNMIKHTGVTFNCDVCSKKCVSARGLSYHKVTHKNYKPYECGLCFLTFPNMLRLYQHRTSMIHK